MEKDLEKVYFIKILELLYAKKVNEKIITPLREIEFVRIVGNVISVIRREKRLKLIVDDGSGQITVFADEYTITDAFNPGDSVLIEGKPIILKNKVFLMARNIRRLKITSEIILRALIVNQYKQLLK